MENSILTYTHLGTRITNCIEHLVAQNAVAASTACAFVFSLRDEKQQQQQHTNEHDNIRVNYCGKRNVVVCSNGISVRLLENSFHLIL